MTREWDRTGQDRMEWDGTRLAPRRMYCTVCSVCTVHPSTHSYDAFLGAVRCGAVHCITAAGVRGGGNRRKISLVIGNLSGSRLI